MQATNSHAPMGHMMRTTALLLVTIVAGALCGTTIAAVRTIGDQAARIEELSARVDQLDEDIADPPSDCGACSTDSECEALCSSDMEDR